jgi:hypothetical protein
MERKDIEDYQKFHSSKMYGTGGKNFPYVLPHVIVRSPASIIDYGAGRSQIVHWLGEAVNAKRTVCFDPAVPGIDVLPDETFELVVSFDVLEHIPEEELDAVLAEMAKLSKDALLVIDTAPAKAILSDGRNAHVCLHEEAWWHKRLKAYFPTIRPFPIGRPHRAAFRTWKEEPNALKRLWIEWRAKRERKWRLSQPS